MEEENESNPEEYPCEHLQSIWLSVLTGYSLENDTDVRLGACCTTNSAFNLIQLKQ